MVFGVRIDSVKMIDAFQQYYRSIIRYLAIQCTLN